MGYNYNCIILIPSLKDKYLCPRCGHLVYPNEAMQTPCGHVYCTPCLSYNARTTKICPQDGMFVSESEAKPLVETDRVLADRIWQTPVRCLYYVGGCLWSGTLFESLSHTCACYFAFNSANPVMCAQNYQVHPQQCMQYYQPYPPMPWSDSTAYMGIQLTHPQPQLSYQSLMQQFIPSSSSSSAIPPPKYSTFMGMEKPLPSFNNSSSPVRNIIGLPQRQLLPLQPPQRLDYEPPQGGRRMKSLPKENLMTSYAINCGNRDIDPRFNESSSMKGASIKVEPFSPCDGTSQLKGTSIVLEPFSPLEGQSIKIESFSTPHNGSSPLDGPSFSTIEVEPFSPYREQQLSTANAAHKKGGNSGGLLDANKAHSLKVGSMGDVVDQNFGRKAPMLEMPSYSYPNVPVFESGGSSQQPVHGIRLNPGNDMDPNSKKRRRMGIICQICNELVEDLEAHYRTKQHNEALSAFIMNNKQHSLKKQRFAG